MLIPDYLNTAIAEITESFCNKKDLQKASHDLSCSYRNHPHLGFTQDLKTRYIYLITRLPATFAALSRVLNIFLSKTHDEITNILDLGSGPGTSIWALHESLPNPFAITCVEKDKQMLGIAKNLYEKIGPNLQVDWQCDNFLSYKTDAKAYDLVILSYVLNEINKDKEADFFKHLESFNSPYILLVEAGSKDGFSRIINMIRLAILAVWSILAPCPHLSSCPLEHTEKWCHFYERLPRTKELKMAKSASMGYEDEKFSYLILCKNRLKQNKDPVILSFPKVASGYVEFEVCNTTALAENITIKKRNKSEYKAAKKLDWGDFVCFNKSQHPS